MFFGQFRVKILDNLMFFWQMPTQTPLSFPFILETNRKAGNKSNNLCRDDLFFCLEITMIWTEKPSRL